MFHYDFFSVSFVYFCYFIFYSKVALQPVSCVVKMPAAKRFTPNLLTAKTPDMGGA